LHFVWVLYLSELVKYLHIARHLAADFRTFFSLLI